MSERHEIFFPCNGRTTLPSPPPRLQMDEVINNNLSIYLPVSPFRGIQNVLLPTEIFSSGQPCDLMRFNDKQNYHD